MTGRNNANPSIPGEGARTTPASPGIAMMAPGTRPVTAGPGRRKRPRRRIASKMARHKRAVAQDKKRDHHANGKRRRTDVVRGDIYDVYVIWQSLPATLRGTKVKYLKDQGIADPDALALLEIRTQRDFARKYGVCEETLCDWNNRPDLMRRVNKARQEWAHKLTSNVYHALYRGILREGDASRVKFWAQLFEGYVERTRHEQTGANGADLFGNLKDVSDEELDRRIKDISSRIVKRD